MKMAEIIRSHIKENGYLKNVIAEKSGIERQKFYRILSGSQHLTVEEYETICRDGFGLDPAYFFKIKFSKSEKQSA